MSERPTRLPGIITKPMSWLYGLGAGYRAHGFDAGRGVVRLDRPVISVGNISAGGTGKSPMVHHIVRTLIENGHHPAIAMRGYKAEPGTLGDEGMEHRLAFADVPIIAQPDRLAGLAALFETDEGKRVDCIVLDDGFQHRRIARDLDLVLIDSSRPPDRDALLPHGFLREPVSALSRADAVVLMHTELVEAPEIARLKHWIQNTTGKRPIACTEHNWTQLEVFDGDEVHMKSPRWLEGRRIIVLCGIGNPRGLLEGVESQGGRISRSFVLGDHESISEDLLKVIIANINENGAHVLLMTRKDWVKLGERRRLIPCQTVVPRLELGFGGGSGPIDTLILASARSGQARA